MNYPWSKDVAKALRRTFMLQEFRTNQLEAINATLGGKDVFCLMPTGGGKSLCYQLPALIDSGTSKGVTVVVSPLLSLIHDQVRHLLNLTIPALMLTGDMQGVNREFALSELFSKEPTTRLVYVTPEFVGRSRQAQDVFTSLNNKGRLARFVIDEAHCVSQWGHDFRPDYAALGKLREQFPDVPMMAMTATANLRVKTDVVASLKIKDCRVFESSFNRPNLRYEVRDKSGKTVVADIAKFIQASHKGQCGIVYCLSRRACEEVAEKLSREHGLDAQHYHAALGKTDRLAIQEAWQAGKFKIIVATIAFGMGIDKGDVRFVVHHTLPQSLEGYYQETGRAGRDGKSSSCILYFSYKDTGTIKRMIDDGDGTEDQKEQQHGNLRRVVQYCMNKSDCRRSQVLQYFGEVFPSESCHHTCDNCCYSAANHQQAVLQDLTVQARHAVELVKDLSRPAGPVRGGAKGGCTLLHYVDVFRGSQSKAIRTKNHHMHKRAGAGCSMNRGDVERLFQELTIRGVFNERSEINAAGFANAYLETPDVPLPYSLVLKQTLSSTAA
ncbi:ATP-dependent DNA helicase [Microstroma glucosiphilum]|uniref:ATP-dependent DNA helicase n=1 Tax=Pseudomicrostroma glucosiphilum TaxID=1684307 RepID=A0A316UHC1_9BASI|nr:ATP-dependent DNA helicase [Pseudomicrostroma glucosiphilum]PWN24308.1 ATP-dependent DNA helicase [Pseudomicrostroma glucosiphilum]